MWTRVEIFFIKIKMLKGFAKSRSFVKPCAWTMFLETRCGKAKKDKTSNDIEVLNYDNVNKSFFFFCIT